MKTINTRGLHKLAIGLTQAFHIGLGETHIAPTENSLPRVFPSTLAASYTGEVLITVGQGAMSADDHARILMQYAFDKGVPVAEVSREYTELLGMLGRSTLIFRELIATIVGTNDRPVTANRAAVVTPTMIHSELRKITKNAGLEPDAIYLYLMADFICHLIRPFGWVIPDNGYTYRLRRPSVFPRYNDVADLLATRELSRILSYLAKADLSTVKRMVDSKQAISPAQISSHMTAAMLHAYDIASSSYDGHAIASSVLTVLYRLWDPSTPEEIRPSGRLQKNEVVNSLLGNLSLLLAAQDLAKNYPEAMVIAFEDEEMGSVILPMFMDALSNSATFKQRILDDVVDFVGKRSAFDSYGAPSTAIFYEGYDVKGGMEAFTPVRHLKQSDARYLVPRSEVTAALNNILAPVASYMDMADIIDHRLQAYELAASEFKGHDNGVNVFLAFPSLVEREVASGYEAGALRDFIVSGEPPETAVIDTDGEIVGVKTDPRVLESLRYDYYAMLMHLAVARSEGHITSVTSVKAENLSNIALTWEGRTQAKHPLGDSAILHGMVVTAEPIESLVYRNDFANGRELKTHLVDLKAHERDVHLWEWWASSRKMEFVAGYATRINNSEYTVEVADYELLGLGVHRENLFYLVPRNVSAMVRLWLESITEEEKFIKLNTGRGTDSLTKQAYAGLRMQTGIQLVRMLATIGSTGVGGRIRALVRRRLAEKMFANGEVDNASQLVVGIQDARLSVWSGLTTLSVLGLLSAKEVTELFRIIRDTQAMPMFVNSTGGR